MREYMEGYNGDWIVPGKEFKILGSVFTKVNESFISTRGLGVRQCVLYEGTMPIRSFTWVVYLDKEFGWPLKLRNTVFEMHFDYDVELNLVETNIPGLKKT